MQPEIVLLCISSLFMVPQERQAFGVRLKVFEVFNSQEQIKHGKSNMALKEEAVLS